MAKFKYRSAVIAPPGYLLLAADLSQAESWVVAALTEDEGMFNALKNGVFHETTAARLYNKPIGQVTKIERYAGKQSNHAFAYRMSAEKHTEVVNKYSDQPPYITIDLKESQYRYNIWHSLYNVRSWWASIDEKISSTRTITTAYGRRRKFYGGLRNEYERYETLKEATAYEPQSTVADHFNGKIHPTIKRSGGLLAISEELRISSSSSRIINQSHDSCCIECKIGDVERTAQMVRKHLRRPLIVNGIEFTIPVDVEVGETYGDLQKLQLD